MDKKKAYFTKEEKAEMKRRETEKEMVNELKMKRQEEFERDQHLNNVKKQMEKIERQRRNRILTHMNNKEHHLEIVRRERDQSLDQKKKENRMKEIEKKNNVKRIITQQEKVRQQTLKRIEQKSITIQALQKEKNSNKWAIEKQKIIDDFEKMKKTGKINSKTLSKLGIELPSKKEIKESLKMKNIKTSFSNTSSTTSGIKHRRLSQPEKINSNTLPSSNNLKSSKNSSNVRLQPINRNKHGNKSKTTRKNKEGSINVNGKPSPS